MGLSKENIYRIEYLLDRCGEEQLEFLIERCKKKLRERRENKEQTRL